MAKSAKKAAPKASKGNRTGTKKVSPVKKAVPRRTPAAALRPSAAHKPAAHKPAAHKPAAHKPARPSTKALAASPKLAAVRAMLEAQRQHDLTAVLACFGPEPMLESAGGPRHVGVERVSQIFSDLFRAFPDLQLEVTAEHESPDSVIVEYLMQGTHRQQWLGMAPRGRSLSLPVCAVFSFDKRGQLASQRLYLDRNLAIVQLTSGLLR